MAVESRREVGAKIREQRRDLGMSQRDLADRSETSESSVKRLEWGQRIDRSKEKLVARALGWADDGIERLYAGKDPGRSVVAAFEAAQVEAKRLKLDTMTLQEMAAIADFVAEVKGDPRAGDDLMEAFLQRRAEIKSTESGTPEVG